MARLSYSSVSCSRALISATSPVRSSFFFSQYSNVSIPRRRMIFVTFHPSMKVPMPTSARMMTLTLGASSSLRRMMAWHRKLLKKARMESPSRDVRCFQNPTSFLNARNANTEWSVPTTKVMAHIFQLNPRSSIISFTSSTSVSESPMWDCIIFRLRSTWPSTRNMAMCVGFSVTGMRGSPREPLRLMRTQWRRTSSSSSSWTNGRYLICPASSCHTWLRRSCGKYFLLRRGCEDTIRSSTDGRRCG
mmetsp:Transcript_8384/g.17329  ORF Transcript_8384/g.17329 Transcript_8384/m.17329 type:complete len:247 (-) Transcript_8384:991-1731(-)